MFSLQVQRQLDVDILITGHTHRVTHLFIMSHVDVIIPYKSLMVLYMVSMTVNW